MAAMAMRAVAMVLLMFVSAAVAAERDPSMGTCSASGCEAEADVLNAMQAWHPPASRMVSGEKPKPEKSERVTTISLADVLELARQHAMQGPRMMKMDIEGAEFQVLRQLLSKQLLCKGSLDLVTIEWHQRFFSRDNKDARLREANQVQHDVRHQKPTHTCTPTTFKDVDDESYLHDGQALPEVPADAKRRYEQTSGSLAASAEMFRGCRAIFFDVGANKATHIRKLFEPHKYPNAAYLKILASTFGPEEQRSKPFNATGLCAFGFEANPFHAKHLADLEATYNARGWRVKLFAPILVTDRGGEVQDLYINHGESEEQWGASIFARP